MSDKRFTIVGEEYVGYTQGNAYIISNSECQFSIWERKEDAQKVCGDLNELVEENEQLKETNEQLRNENERLRQFYAVLDMLEVNNTQLREEIERLKCMNNQLERRLDYSIAYDMGECE